MSLVLVLVIIGLASLATLAFATLSYSLREVSRVRLGEALEKRGRPEMLEATIDRRNELVLATAIGRLAGNTIILLATLYAYEQTGLSTFWRYGLSLLTAGALSLLFSVALPHAMARYSADSIVASTVDLLHVLRLLVLFITIPMHWIDDVIRRAVGASGETGAEEIEQEILSAVEEGAAEGVVGD